jgi:catechol-2,3-dioxygenase
MVKQRLADEAIPFTLSQSGRDPLFCRDPDGNGIELVAG